ncbi:MAG: hypothetical protein QXW13_01555 [Nanopusillaceae archaeon]
MSCITELFKYYYKSRKKLDDIIKAFKKEIIAYNIKTEECEKISLSLTQYLSLEIKGYLHLNDRSMYLVRYNNNEYYLVDNINKKEKYVS